jgi:cytochrome c553
MSRIAIRGLVAAAVLLALLTGAKSAARLFIAPIDAVPGKPEKRGRLLDAERLPALPGMPACHRAAARSLAARRAPGSAGRPERQRYRAVAGATA